MKKIKNTRKTDAIKRFALVILYIILIALVGLLGYLIFNDNKQNAQEKVQEVSSSVESFPEETEEEPIPEPVTYTASILSAGDVILHSPFVDSTIYNQGNGTYDYNSIFTYIKDDYSSADFSVVNLELTIADGNYSGYPLFRSPESIASALNQSGVDLCLLANNHIYDNSDKGLTMTMDYVEQYSMQFTGTRKTTDDRKYFIQDINGIKVGIFNYVYETGSNSSKAINGISVSSTSSDLINSFNYDNLEAMYSEIQTGLQEMKNEGIEYTIAYLHWGNEYQTTENDSQRAIAKQLCELGIDALIGGHPHVVQPVDLLTNSSGDHQMICAYSMGNHLSNQRQELMDSMPEGHTEDGLMIQLTLEKTDDGPVLLIQAEFIPTWVYKTLANGGAEYYILPLNDPEQIIQEASGLDISTDVQNSLDRTNAIIQEGVNKIQNALPISSLSN